MDNGDGSFAPMGIYKERAELYKGRLTSYVVVSCLVAAVGGALFGYDIGVSGSSVFLHILAFFISSLIFDEINSVRNGRILQGYVTILPLGEIL